jgi:hypothetical protein
MVLVSGALFGRQFVKRYTANIPHILPVKESRCRGKLRSATLQRGETQRG